jgi:putative transposase
MENATPELLSGPGSSARDVLCEIVRRGAEKMLAAAIESEVEEYIQRHAEERGSDGRRLVVRNGHLPERVLETGIGGLQVRQPRVNDRRTDAQGEPYRFTSRFLPPYLRRLESLDELVPWLYLRGISTSDFSDFLRKLTGDPTVSLSPTTVVRLKEVWQEEHRVWSKRSLEGHRYVYFWVDGIYANIRLENERQCILVVMGATEDGVKELVAIQDGVRESEQSWIELLLDLKKRGLEHAPALVVGDGALGFWAALPKVFSTARAQRCWVHKTANVLNYFPTSKQAQAKEDLHEIWMAETKAEAEKALRFFGEKYGAKYPKAVNCLTKDREELLAFYDFPAEHWKHLRTTNPIESTFATVRLRHRRTKGSGSRAACLAMIFKLAKLAERRWRKLDATELLKDIIFGAKFKDGIKVDAA